MFERQKVWIDRSVQGVLIGRLLLYWSIALLYIVLGMVFFQLNRHADWTVYQHASALLTELGPWLPSAVLCMPLVIYDVIRLSNQFVGPIHRMRVHLGNMLEDPNCPQLSFREHDYWTDLANPINQLQNQLLAMQVALEESHRRAVESEAKIAQLNALYEQQEITRAAVVAEADSDQADSDKQDVRVSPTTAGTESALPASIPLPTGLLNDAMLSSTPAATLVN